MMFLYLPLSANVAPPVTFPPPAPDVPMILRKADNKYKPSVKLNYCDLFSLNYILNSKYHQPNIMEICINFSLYLELH